MLYSRGFIKDAQDALIHPFQYITDSTQSMYVRHRYLMESSLISIYNCRQGKIIIPFNTLAASKLHILSRETIPFQNYRSIKERLEELIGAGSCRQSFEIICVEGDKKFFRSWCVQAHQLRQRWWERLFKLPIEIKIKIYSAQGTINIIHRK